LLVFKLSELRLKRHVFTISEEKMSQDKKVAAETKLTEEEKLFEEKKTVDPYIAGFVESMAKTNTEKINKEILEGLSEDTGDSDSYDVESGDEDSEDRPWRPSHSIFEKSTIKQSHLENMRGRYFRDMSIVRAGRDNNVPAPEENEVVIFRSFFKAGLRFPLSKFVVEVLKTYQIFLHLITPEAIIRMGIFVWAARSQARSASAICTNYYMRRRPWVKNSITITSVVMDLSPAPTQATQCQHFGRDGPELGWKNGFM
jgi:hypothetical protein